MPFDQLGKVMVDEYDNDARQLTVQSRLELTTLDKLMTDEDVTDVNIGLEKLVNKIANLVPQNPRLSQ